MRPCGQVTDAMAMSNITEDDEGKRVVTNTGENVGMIKSVRGGTAYVDPNPDMFDRMKSKLNWGDTDEDTYPIDENNVAEVTSDEVRLS